MTTAPIPSGKIRGSLRDVTPKLRNFVGAVKVTTPSGKGGILVEMGKTVASYLTVDGVLHRGKESLELLEKEQLAEFEILRYDEEQFREAMLICDNRGLLLGGQKGEAAPAAAPPAPAREEKPQGEENVLSAMMKRFAAPKVAEKPPVTRELPKAEAKAPAPVEEPLIEELREPGPSPPSAREKAMPIPERKEAAAAPPPPPAETELSAIIRRLRETGGIEKAPAQPEAKPGGTAPKAGVPEAAEGKVTAPGPSTARVSRPRPPVEERAPPEPVPPGIKSEAAVPEGQPPEGRVKVDLGKMMKRIKRLDITSIREELQAGAGEEPAGGPARAPLATGGEPGEVATAPVQAPAPSAETAGKSDIDELKAFIQRLEVLEEPEEEPREKGFLERLGGKAVPGEAPEPVMPRKREAPEPAMPRKRELPAPVPRREVSLPVEEPPAEEARPAPKIPEERPVPPRPAEPDRKARIASLLRRSGLVKPPAEEQPKEPVPGIAPEPIISRVREEPPAPVEEVEIQAPRPQRKKVEITRVPKKAERPIREPPLLDEKMIQKILKQPGVIAVSTFFEGFAVQSAGRADFEQVAANAEDLFRAGKKIAREIDIGPLNQIILETGKGKLVIAPHGDLNVCIFTEPDANLGLIRVAIRSMQVEKD
jgi:predicted regulator of Ras-like GTPase activity (Roadblock/LC7/MglB family)